MTNTTIIFELQMNEAKKIVGILKMQKIASSRWSQKCCHAFPRVSNISMTSASKVNAGLD